MIEKILERLREKSNEWFERWAESGSEDEYADGRNDSFDEAIQIVQEVAKDGGWIPCSERLPEFPKSDEDEKSYLVTVKRNDGFTFWDRLIFHDYGWRIPGNCEVTAWQEVTPYQKGE